MKADCHNPEELQRTIMELQQRSAASSASRRRSRAPEAASRSCRRHRYPRDDHPWAAPSGGRAGQAKGPRFELFFPLASEPALVDTVAEPPAVITPPAPRRILVVDDEKVNLQILEMALSMEGFIVTTAASGNEALEVFRTDPNRFDVVITDQKMPGIQGSELALKLREARPDIPVILITGWMDETIKQLESDSVIKAVIAKPHTPRKTCSALWPR